MRGKVIFITLNYYWRIFATGICFILFSIGSIITAVFIFPILRLLPLTINKRKYLAQHFIYYALNVFTCSMEILGVLKITIKGIEKLPAQKSALIIANHPTLIDAILLMTLWKKSNCIVKQALWQNLFLRHIFKTTQYISNDTDPQQLLQQCHLALQNGDALLIFPEGTRTSPGKKLKFQRGAANIALKSKHNIIPVVILSQYQTLTKEQKWYQIPYSDKVRITLIIYDTIDIHAFIPEDKEKYAIASRKLTQYLEIYFQQELLSHQPI